MDVDVDVEREKRRLSRQGLHKKARGTNELHIGGWEARPDRI